MITAIVRQDVDGKVCLAQLVEIAKLLYQTTQEHREGIFSRIGGIVETAKLLYQTTQEHYTFVVGRSCS